MSQINNQQDIGSYLSALGLSGNKEIENLLSSLKKSGSINGSDDLPPSKNAGGSPSSDLPSLPPSKLAAGGSIALDILLDAIGEKVRQSETKAGIATVKANAASREAANQEKLKKIEEQIEKLESKSVWDKIANVFKWIGMAVAAIGCAAMIATGVGSGVGVAGLVLLGTMVANEVLDTVGQAVNGEGWGLTSLLGKAVEKIFDSKEAGMWVKFGLDIALSVAAIICTCGAGASSAAGNTASTLQKVAGIVTKASSVAKGITGVAGAGANIASAVYTKDIEYSKADQKRLQAILEQIQMINELVTKHMKQVIEDSQKIAETVNDIVKENAAAQTAILTNGGGASMA